MKLEVPREVLYVDSGRLESYTEQLLPSPVTFDEVKHLKAELAITGPSAAFEQQVHARGRTTWEQFQVVLQRLKDAGALATNRSTVERDPPVFVREQCDALRVGVPSQKLRAGDTPVFAFWLSPQPAVACTASALCLLEDFRSTDSPPQSFYGFSTYTLLQSLIYFTRREISSTILARYISEPVPDEYALFKEKPASLVEYHHVREFAYDLGVTILGRRRSVGQSVD